MELRANLSKFEQDLKRKLAQTNAPTKAFESHVNSATKGLDRFKISSADVAIVLGAGLAGGAAFAAREILRFGAATIEAASALNEQRAAADQVFESHAALVRVFAEGASAIGLSERAALKATVIYGGLFQNMGIGTEEAAKLSTGLVQLGADLSSFFDIPTEEVQTKIISGLRGQSEAIEDLNINVLESRINAEALSHGIVENAADLTEAQKVLVRYIVALEDSQKAQGDIARTSDSLANRQRRANAEWENAKAALGEGLQRPAIAAVQTLSGLVHVVELVADGIERLGQAAATSGPGLEKAFGVHLRVALGITTLGLSEVAIGLGKLGDKAVPAAQDLGTFEKELESLARDARDFGAGLESLNKALPDLESTLESIAEQRRSSAERVQDAERSLARAVEDATERRVDAEQRIVDVEMRAARQIIDAQRSIADAHEQAAKDIEAATRRVQDSREALADAERDLERLTSRRRPETQREQHMRAIAEAEKDVQDARERLTQDEATLADTREETARRIADAEQNLRDVEVQAQRDIADAHEALERTIKQTSQSIGDAQRNVSRSHDEAARAAKKQQDQLDEVIKSLRGSRDALTEYERNILGAAASTGDFDEKLSLMRDLLDSLQGRNLSVDVNLTEQQKELEAFNKEMERLLFNSSALASVGIGAGAGGQVQGLPRRQHGGPLAAGQLSLVGERGPELFAPRQPGQVISNDSIAQLARVIQSSGRTNQNVFNMNLPSIADPDFFARAIAMRLGQMMYR